MRASLSWVMLKLNVRVFRVKANEYVKLVGWEYAKLNASSCSHQYYFLHNCYAEVCVSELRLLVESYDLVQEYGGVLKAKDFISVYGIDQLSKKIYSPMFRLKQAIADVESCNE